MNINTPVAKAAQPTGFFERLWLFTKERFEPVTHFVMISVFVAFHFMLVAGKENEISLTGIFMLLLGSTAFFFKLRAYDEIKDYEVDLKFKPHRPLARGLVTHNDLHRVIMGCIFLEIATFSFFGPTALAAMAFAIAYSLLMFKEFFIGKYLRPHLTTYAVTHTIVGGLLALSILSAVRNQFFWSADQNSIQAVLAAWGLFNIFEFGRKTYCRSEERPEIESYSKIFGQWGAVALVVGMGIFSAYLLGTVDSMDSILNGSNQVLRTAAWLFLVGGPVITMLFGAAYAATDHNRFGAIYRAASSMVIVFVYGGLSAVLFLNRGN